MSADKTDYDKLVKNHLRMRLMESGWTNNLTHFIKSRIAQRLEAGEPKNSIKFEQLYNEVINRARLAVPVEMENEFHQKVSEYLSVNLDETSVSSVPSHNLGALSQVLPQGPSNIPSSVLIHDPTDVPSSVLSHGTSNVSSSILPHGLSDISAHVPSDIPSDVISNDDE